MHPGWICRFGAIGLFVGSAAFAQTPAATLLDEVISTPGGFNQMCFGPPTLDPAVPLPLYTVGPQGNYYLSQSNIARLKERRAEVASEINRRLLTLDLSKVPQDSSRSATASGQEPSALSVLLLNAALQTDAVEALPGLLKVEAELQKRLQMAADGMESALPEFSYDGSGRPPPGVGLRGPAKDPEASKRDEAAAKLFTVRLFQRRLLSVIAALVRHERYAPLLNSDVERAYVTFLQLEALKPQLRAIKKPADIPPLQRDWIYFDPFHDLPVNRLAVGYMPYTEFLRTEIRKFAEDLLKKSKTV